VWTSFETFDPKEPEEANKTAKNSNTQYVTQDERASSESEQECRAYLAQCMFTGG
jgi:hypothetical protein